MHADFEVVVEGRDKTQTPGRSVEVVGTEGEPGAGVLPEGALALREEVAEAELERVS